MGNQNLATLYAIHSTEGQSRTPYIQCPCLSLHSLSLEIISGINYTFLVKGKIILKVKELAELNGIANAHQLQKALDVAPMVARRLWSGELTKFDLRTLERLCEKFNCQPNDLIEYLPEN